ncbi:aldo/keto reductase [Colwellia sp. E2M01]|uniref:aldo/keto reductase n=1 Tax=Colwellia sp. E2M01 TaxID=2841561 RepID=UPI001C084334|nr:aldo/keto reductase [Colwellia sp. E2M01]MBU2872164.1 aldo/keto reductase [Colwellia sp. E2M01]
MSDNKYPLSKMINNNSSLVFGCMGLGGTWDNNPITAAQIQQAHDVVDTALDANITLFDHADIYNLGKAEQVFGEVLKARPELRDLIAIQSKCGIRFADSENPQRYDSSPEWITHSVENSLSRLNIEQLDILMLHRPDPLMEPELIAEAFDSLIASGKVKSFGVSNMQQHQMAYLSSALSQPLVVNQVELSLSHLAWLEEGVTSGNSGEPVVNYGAGTLEYCRQNNIQLQSWGCLSQGIFTGRDISQQALPVQRTAELVGKLAAEYQVSKEAIVLAWLKRHPANIQPVIGTTNVERIKACAEVDNLTLTREHWYALWLSARGHALP